MDAQSERLAAIGRSLRVAGDVGIRREVQKTIRAAAQPLVPIIQESAQESLPKAGGMNEFVAKRRPRISVRTGARTAGVSIRYAGKGAPSDRGPWRHPVFGHRDRWVSQTYVAGEHWWERAEERGTPLAKVAMATVLEKVARQVMR